MNSKPTLSNESNSYVRILLSDCPCCGRPVPKFHIPGQFAPTDEEAEQMFKNYISDMKLQIELKATRERAQQALQRADYVHLIPLKKRSAKLTPEEIQHYKEMAYFERLSKERWEELYGPDNYQEMSEKYFGTLMKVECPNLFE